MMPRRFLTVSRTNGAHTNSSMPDLNKQANKGVSPVLFRGRLRVPRGLCLCATCQTSFGGTRTGHADHHVETNGVKLFVGLEREFCSYPPQDMSTSTSTSTLSIELTRGLRAGQCIVPTSLYARRRRHQAAYSAVQCSAAQLLDARSRREAARLGSHHP